ncbi:MAG: flippase [Candidatus Woesearchaeota archaeon]
MEILQNKSLKETLWSFLSKGATIILFLIINIILARSLGVESFGLWSLFLSVITILFTLSYFGINASTKKFVAQYNKTSKLRGVLISSIKLRIIFSLIFSLLLLVSYKPLSLLINPELEILFLYGVPLIFFSGLVQFQKNVFMGLHRLKYNFIVNLSEFGLKLLLVILFLLFSNSVISVINSFVVALLITSIVGGYLLFFNFYKPLAKTSQNFTKEIINYSYPLIFISLGFIVLTEIDTVMIGIFSTSSEVGIYGIAKQIVIKLPHLSLAIAMGTMPVFAKMNENNKLELKKKLFNLLKIVSGIYGVIVIGLLLFSPFFIPLIFGKEYIDSILPLQILSIYTFMFAISIILGQFLDYTGRAKKRAYNVSVTIILNIILNLILIPQFGGVGAAIATTVSYFPYAILNWMEVKKIFGL